jgi:hypothetical protein
MSDVQTGAGGASIGIEEVVFYALDIFELLDSEFGFFPGGKATLEQWKQ